jgi:hypothetical protein
MMLAARPARECSFQGLGQQSIEAAGFAPRSFLLARHLPL